MFDKHTSKILVIEDEISVRANIIELLEAENFHAIGAPNGQLGISKAQEEIPDLILCDIMMPDMDGYTVLTELQKDPMTAIIPFIFLTAKVEREDLRLGMELGADDYITKPCTNTELLSAISIRLKKLATYIQQYAEQQNKARKLQKRVQELQKLSKNREDLLQKISEDLRDPLSNITMAIEMLKLAPNEQARAYYLKILHQECAREIGIINQLANLATLINPEDPHLFRRFNLNETENYEKNSSN